MEANILLSICIFVSVWHISLILLRAIRGQEITIVHFLVMSAALTGLITHFIGIW